MVKLSLLFVILGVGSFSLGVERPLTFSMADSVLLFGDYGNIRITSPTTEQSLGPPVANVANQGYFAYPSISPSGGLIAWGFAVGRDQRRTHGERFALGIYSTSSREWKTYGDFDFIGYAAFSRDGSKVAVVALSGAKHELFIFDPASEKLSRGPYHSGMPESGGVSWSPDDQHLAVEIQRGDLPQQVAVLDLISGDVHPVGEGYEPAWSPSGEWIAYYTDDKCLVVHPDGTGTRVVKKLSRTMFLHTLYLHQYRTFVDGLVWSPDSKQLLLNELKADGPDRDVMLLDLSSGRSIRKCENCLPVFGWAVPK